MRHMQLLEVETTKSCEKGKEVKEALMVMSMCHVNKCLMGGRFRYLGSHIVKLMTILSITGTMHTVTGIR